MGLNDGGAVTASYATGAVSGNQDVGGLVGENAGPTITNSYATGTVSGTTNVGGLAGVAGTTSGSYFDTDTSGQSHATWGKTTAELQTPTDVNAGDTGGDYENWSADNWHFGIDSQYPALKVDFDGDGRVDPWTDFGYQLRETPVLTADSGATQVRLSWEAVSNSHWSDRPTITYNVYRDGAVLEEDAGTSHTDRPDSGVIHQYQVVALVNGGQGSRSTMESAGTGVDYDADDNDLIEIKTLAQLDAIRHDLDGVGDVDDGSDPATDGSDAAIYTAAFPNAAFNMGCDTTCTGYELDDDLDFAGSEWDSGEGWAPIGGDGNPFTGDFEGNGNVISNLFINRATPVNGLFGVTSGTVRNLGLARANVTATGDSGNRTGVLAGENKGTIENSYATGAVAANNTSGGLAGKNAGAISASYATVSVTGAGDNIGGLVGKNQGSITNSYAAGPVSGSSNAGGLTGQSGTITKGYFDSEVSGRSGGIGRTTAQLQTPTSNTAPLRRLDRRRVGLRH